jgi:hypothetical protein
MADLKVDYQLLASIHATMTGLATEFQDIEDQASSYAAAYGYDAITGAMGSFAGNWSDHRQKLLGTMRSLDHMVTSTSSDFQRADTQLASGLAASSQPKR